MSRAVVLRATCNAAGVVTAEGQTVPAARVLTQGAQASSGILIMYEDRADYIATNTTDIVTVIDKLILVCDDAAAALNSLGAQVTSLGGDGATAIAKATSLLATKVQLTTLKGALK